MSDSKKAASEEVARVLELIRRSKEQDLLFLQTVRDAALLAGEQVQDVRIRLLENPPGAESENFLLDVLISLTLGPAANTLVKKFAGFAVEHVLGTRGLLEGALDLEGALGKAEQSNIGSGILKRGSELRKLWTDKANEVIGEPKRLGISRLRASKPSDSSKADVSDPGDTASVAVRRAAFGFARIQEPFTVRTHEDLAKMVSDGLPSLILSSLKAFFTSRLERPANITRYDNSVNEKSLSLMFEASIWVMQLGDTMEVIHPSTEFRTVVIPPKWTKLFAYFIRRFPYNFGDGIESFYDYFARTWNKKGVEPNPLAGIVGEYSAEQKAYLELLNWFDMLQKEQMSAVMDFGSGGYRVLGPVNPKVATSQ